MKTKNGFTLIELLAVIVILAIIALIATPIVLNIINESKESAQLRSAEFYLDAVGYTIADAILNHGGLDNGKYPITPNGDICKTVLPCTDEDTLKVQVKGEKPTSGYINIQSGKIENIELGYDNKTIAKNNEGKLEFLELLYKIGDEVTFNPGDIDRTWNVIDEDSDTVTLILSQNLESTTLGKTVAWYSNAFDSNYGPKDALEYLNGLTKDWNNVDPIERYSYVNNLNGNTKTYGYRKIEINKGVTILTHKDGTTTKLDETNKAKARFLTIEEAIRIASKTKQNLTVENLKEYITKNIPTINTGFGISLTSVDQVIQYFITELNYDWISSESEHMKLYIVAWMLSEEIDKTYDILLPNYLYQNLNHSESIDGYWLFSTDDIDAGSAWVVFYDGHLDYDRSVRRDDYIGVRPVITIPKSKLN